MIDRRRLSAAIGAVMAYDEFSVHRRDLPGVQRPAQPAVNQIVIILRFGDLIRLAIVVVSKHQDRGPARAGTEHGPSSLALTKEFAMNYVPHRPILVWLGNGAVVTPENCSYTGGQFREVLHAKPPDSPCSPRRKDRPLVDSHLFRQTDKQARLAPQIRIL